MPSVEYHLSHTIIPLTFFGDILPKKFYNLKMQIALFLVFFFFALSNTSWATHAIVGSGIGQTGPITTIAAPTSLKNKWVFEMQTEFLKFDEFSDDELRKFAESDEDIHSVRSLLNASLGIGYGITDNFDLSVKIPYIIRSNIKESHHDEPEEIYRHGDAKGIGDLSIIGRYRFVRLQNMDFESTLLFGMKVPTGTTTDKDISGERFEAEFQPGSGSWDLMGGFAFTKRFANLSLDANILYNVVTEGMQNTDLGDAFNYNVALSHHTFEKPISWDLIVEINGIWREKQEIDGRKDNNSGGNIIFLSPGVRFSWHQLTAFFSIGVPVIQNMNGIQNDTDIRLAVGISVAF